MWGLSYTGTAASDIDFAWLLPYYNGSNKAYVSTPGNNLIDMGAVTAGDRYGVQVSGTQVVYTKLPAGSTTWQTMYVFSPTITYSLEFRGRVEDYAQVFNAFAGSSCQMVVVSTPTPSPTSTTGGGIAQGFSAAKKRLFDEPKPRAPRPPKWHKDIPAPTEPPGPIQAQLDREKLNRKKGK
jgi:hypothetical protein